MRRALPFFFLVTSIFASIYSQPKSYPFKFDQIWKLYDPTFRVFFLNFGGRDQDFWKFSKTHRRFSNFIFFKSLHSTSVAGSNELTNCTCVAGYAAALDGVACRACEVGTFKATAGSDELTDCACLPGYAAASDGVACAACEAGTFKENSSCRIRVVEFEL